MFNEILWTIVLIFSNFINISKPFNVPLRISDCIYLFFIYWSFINKWDLMITFIIVLLSKFIYSLLNFYVFRIWNNLGLNFVFNFIPFFSMIIFVYYFYFSDSIKSLWGKDFLFLQVFIYFLLLYFLFVTVFYFLNLFFNFRVYFNENNYFFYDDLKFLLFSLIFNSSFFLIIYDLSTKSIYLVYLLIIGLLPVALTNYNYNWIIRATMRTIEKIASVIESKNIYAKGHSEKVSELCVKFSRYLNLDYDDIEKISHAAKIMNIGYISIPEYVFGKATNLSPNEMKYIKDHPLIAYNIFQKLDIYKDISNIIKSHHESWDGSGYPEGLMGSSIPFLARVIRICDVFVALQEERPYRKAYSIQEALEILHKEKTKFDPEIFEKFIDFIQKEYGL